MDLTAEQREIGKINFLTAFGEVRRDFLTRSLQAPRTGSYYFGYPGPDGKPVKAGIVGTGNEGCEAMIRQSSPEYLEFVAFHDIRPSQQKRAEKEFASLYGPAQGAKVKKYDDYPAMLADKDIEAIVIATPLWTHADLAILALDAGKHVLCEKLMAHNITDAKKMIRAADKNKRILSVGHQRHYSTLYDNALAVIRSGYLGDIRYIRALWHRNNTFLEFDPRTLADTKTIYDGWTPKTPEADENVNFKKYGYKSLKELICWRLYNRTGGGLMAELGSHQLDACSLFLNKTHPQAVSGVGGKYFYTDDRECEDHVYCTFEMPGGVVVTYSSINTNAQAGYGEIITGSKGSLLILNERDVMLFKEREPGDKSISQDLRVTIGALKQPAGAAGAKPAPGGEKLGLVATESLSLPSVAALAKVALDRTCMFQPPGAKTPMVNRGYHEEMEAFASAIRNSGVHVRCDGRVALADAVMALSSNVAMRTTERIAFKPSWYDPASDDVPDARPTKPDLAVV